MSELAVLEERPPYDHEILRALFDTIPVVFAKEEKGKMDRDNREIFKKE